MKAVFLGNLLALIVVAASINVEVDLFTDSAGVASNCDPANGQCNLRSAWTYCTDQLGADCRISLPADSQHTFDASLGHLILSSDSNIEIIGNDATISKISVRRLTGSTDYHSATTPNSQPSQSRALSASDFPFTMTDFGFSNDAKDVYDTACVTACPFDVLVFSACDNGQDTSHDTYFRLFQGDNQVAENDDTCDHSSEIEYSVPSDGPCQEYCLHMGCFGADPCATTVTLSHLTFPDGLSSPSSTRLIFMNNTDAVAVPSLALRSLTLESFGGDHLHGGALFLDGQVTLTIDNTNIASASGYIGGALYISNNAQEVHISGTTFTQAVGNYGGAVYIGTEVSRLSITDCTFADCKSSDFGGAVFVDDTNPDISITNSGFARCAARFGGALAFGQNNENLAVTNCTFADCAATLNGGGIFVHHDNTFGTVEKGSFLRCLAGDDGGGVSVADRNHHFTLRDVTMHTCKTSDVSTLAFGGGGGLSAGSDNTFLTIDSSNFRACTCRGIGGAVFFMYRNTHSLVENTAFIECMGPWGAGIGMFQDNNYVSVLGSKFDFCIASQAGGGVYVQSQNTHFELANSVVSDCATTFHGGGIIIMVDNHHASLRDVVIRDCEASYRGGGIMLMNNGNVTLQNVSISGCSALLGGGVYADTGSVNFNAVELHISDCTAEQDGGGLYIGRKNQQVILRDSSIRNCEAKDGNGGGLHVDSKNDDFALESVTVLNCTAYDGGGLFFVSNDHIDVRNCEIRGCSARRSGGGVNLYGANANVNFISTVIAENRARRNGGGVYSGRDNIRLMLVGTTVTGNNALNNGGGVYVESGNPQFSLLDEETYAHRQVLDSAHPYEYTQASWPIDAGSAVAFFVYFSEETRIAPQDKIRITTGTPGVDEQTFFNSDDGLWPGINTPALRLTDPTALTVKLECFQDDFFAAISAADGYYGFRLYVIPIFEEASTPSVISDNVAAANGGGLFMFSGVSFPFSMHTQFVGNEAFNGGASYLRNAVVGMVTYGNLFLRNKATGGSGGATMVSSACHALLFDNCNYTANSAEASGGAVAFTTNNGNDGGLEQDNENFFRFCTFLDNQGHLSGGALYLDLSNNVKVVSSEFSGSYTVGDGAAVMLSQSNTVLVDGCTVHHNTALACGGGFAEGTSNFLTLRDVVVHDNYANQFGGGICVKTDSSLALSGTTAVSYNRVGVAGGGIACFGSYLPTSEDTEIQGNFAGRGSGMYLSAINQRAGSSDLAGVRFIENMAGSGTVFWATGGMSEPGGLHASGVRFVDNRVDFGSNVSTQAIQMLYPENITVSNYDTFLDPPVEITLIDYYGESVVAHDPVVVTVSLQEPSAAQCKGRFPFLSGTDVSASGVVFVDGKATLASTEVACSPGGWVTLLFTAVLNDLSADFGDAQRTVLGAAKVTFRDCVAGETIVNGKCVVCPLGTYSLVSNVTVDTVCTECLSLGSVDNCAADQIVLSDGYWRRHPTSETILPCLDELSGCSGGDKTADASCLIGYEGPLCSLCSEGYYRSEKKCIPCVDKGRLSPAAAFFTAVGGAGLLAGLAYLLYKLQNNGEAGVAALLFVVAMNIAMWFKKEVRDMKVQMKIVITTFQICSAIPVAMTVAFPTQFSKYLDAMTVFNLNVMSVVPVNCANSGGYNFIDKLVMLTLAPIGLSLLLLLACVVEYTYRRIAYDRLHTQEVSEEERDVRDKKMRAVVSRYLTLFFLLTYLVLPFIATTLFRTFLCTDLDPNNEDSDPNDLFLTADMRISCTSDYYKRGVAYAAVMIVVYVIGIPSMYLILLYRSRKEIMERFDPLVSSSLEPYQATGSPKGGGLNETELIENKGEKDGAQAGAGKLPPAATAGSEADAQVNQLKLRHDHAAHNALMISFLYEAYEPKYWYWEVVETTRRLMLTAVLSVCGPGTSAQALLAVLLALMYIKLYGYYAPYLKDTDDIVAETGQFQIFLSFLGALVYQRHLLGEEWNNAVGAVLILVNTAVFFLFIYFAATTLYKDVKAVDISVLSARAPGITSKPATAEGHPTPTAGTPAHHVDRRKVYIAPDNEDEKHDPSQRPPIGPGTNNPNGTDRQEQHVGFVNLHNSQYPLQLDSTVYNINHSADNSVCSGPEQEAVKPGNPVR